MHSTGRSIPYHLHGDCAIDLAIAWKRNILYILTIRTPAISVWPTNRGKDQDFLVLKACYMRYMRLRHGSYIASRFCTLPLLGFRGPGAAASHDAGVHLSGSSSAHTSKLLDQLVTADPSKRFRMKHRCK